MTKRPSAAGEDGLIPCLVCGRRFRSLGPHLFRIHRVSAADYRAEFRLPATVALMATSTRETLSVIRREAMVGDPSLVERMRAAALPLEELARRSAEARSGTDGLPAVRAARRRGWDERSARGAAAFLVRREEAARAAGYGSWREGIEATRSLSGLAAARRLGVGKATVQRWRERYAATPLTDPSADGLA